MVYHYVMTMVTTVPSLENLAEAAGMTPPIVDCSASKCIGGYLNFACFRLLASETNA